MLFRSAEKVRETVEQSQNLIFKISSVQRAPRKWPNITHGKEIYSKNCTQCHGVSGQGDGPSAGNFDPKPTNFLDSKSDFISPFQFFNAIHLGVPGTAMSAFQSISETETWDLAFYLSSLRHKNKNVEAALTHPWTLEQVASLSDNELRKTLTSTENVESALTLARTFNVSEEIGRAHV